MMAIVHFNHLSLHVSDVARSKIFYGSILGLPLLERPHFSFDGAWYDMGNGLQLHLIAGKDYETKSSNRGNHFAFTTSNVDDMELFLRRHGVEIVANKLRVDGAKQLFVKDPDGYFVEFNEDER